MAKKAVIFVVVGVVVLLLGIGGGVMVGLKFFGPDKPKEKLLPPGPTVSVGNFTINLADPEPHLIQLGVTLEMEDPDAAALLSDAGWMSRVKNEIILTVKDRRYDELKSSEGAQILAQDLRGRLNSLLPRTKKDDKVAVRQVLFDQFMLQ
ncbi:MAG: flagellar basal body-associated FliL family protein [Thermanaerothrix sp.]|nr:flagellar basal body-associated FliL family protein [Thermanaerothrix sp.]